VTYNTVLGKEKERFLLIVYCNRRRAFSFFKTGSLKTNRLVRRLWKKEEDSSDKIRRFLLEKLFFSGCVQFNFPVKTPF
jgi:hypothetical protein